MEAEISVAVPHAETDWIKGDDVCRLTLSRSFSGGWSPDQEAQQLDWLLATSNAFINSVRPRVLRLLPGGEAA